MPVINSSRPFQYILANDTSATVFYFSSGGKRALRRTSEVPCAALCFFQHCSRPMAAHALPRGVVFDKDGTLLSAERTWLPLAKRLVADVAASLGAPESEVRPLPQSDNHLLRR